MSERPGELKDDGMSNRLRAEMGSMPPRLAVRLEHLAAAGLRDAHPRATPLWAEVAPQILGAALVLALFVGAMLRLHAFVAAAGSLSAALTVRPVTPASVDALGVLLLPLATLLWVEALRGAPTVQRWLYRRG
jgi:hypothetical protein